MVTLLFDIDGTLIHSGGAGTNALYRAFEDTFSQQLRESVAVHGRTDRGIVANLLQSHGVEDTPANRERLLAHYWDILPASLANGRGTVLPGVVKLVKELADRNDVALGLLTGNTAMGAELKLKHYGLYDFFQFGGYGDEHADRNDVAKVAVVAAEEWLENSLDRSKTWVIGDTIFDIRCAQAVQCRSLALLTGGQTAESLRQEHPDALLDDLADLEKVLEVFEL